MSPDVAGATIMAIGTSVPELFVNIIGTFLTQGDIGVGTGVGGDVVVIIAAPALCVLITGLVSRTILIDIVNLAVIDLNLGCGGRLLFVHARLPILRHRRYSGGDFHLR